MDKEYFEIISGLEKLNISLYKPDTIVYKYVDIKSGIEILTNSTLLYQCPDKFNDPFDPHLGLLDFNKSINRMSSISTLKYPTDVVKELFRGAYEKFKNELGILCLSRTNMSTLMWSHYSQKHTGLCLGFNTKAFINSDDDLNAFNVNYTYEFKPVEHSFVKSNKDVIDLIYWLCTKSKVWEYEQEVRVLEMYKNGYLPFDKIELVELYFGASTSKQNIDIINEIIKNRDYHLAKVGKMIVSKTKFELEVEYLNQ